MMTIDQIKLLKEGATKGPWTNKYGDIDQDVDPWKTIVGMETKGSPYMEREELILSKADSAFIAALPDIADTAIKALERVEELEEMLGMRGECSCRERVHRHRITCNHHPDNL